MAYKINDLTPLGRNLASTDQLEVSLSGATGSRKITGAQIIGAQVGYKGFKYNIGYGEDYPNPPVPLAGQAFILTDSDGTFQGFRISLTDANGKNNSLYLNNINGQPITIANVDGSISTYVAGSVTFVPGANPYYNMPPGQFSGPILSGVAYIDYNTSLPELVSGTTIKTINSTSVLGSGDLAIPTVLHAPYVTPGNSYTNTLTGGGLAGGFSQVVNREGSLTPFTPLKTFTVSSFSILAASYSGLVGGVVGIYQNSSGQQIGGTVYKAHQALLNLTEAASIYTVSSTFTFNAGVTYWIGYFVYTVPGAPGASLYVSDPRTMLPISSPVSLTQNIGYVITGLGGSSTLPSSFNLSSYSQSSLKQFQVWWNVSSVL